PHGGDVLNAEPVQLKVLAVGDVERPAAVGVREIRNRPAHCGRQVAVGRADAHHEVADRVATYARAIALGVESPGAEPDREIIGGDTVEPLACVAPDVVEDGPGRALALDAFYVLGGGLLWWSRQARHEVG